MKRRLLVKIGRFLSNFKIFYKTLEEVDPNFNKFAQDVINSSLFSKRASYNEVRIIVPRFNIIIFTADCLGHAFKNGFNHGVIIINPSVINMPYCDIVFAHELGHLETGVSEVGAHLFSARVCGRRRVLDFLPFIYGDFLGIKNTEGWKVMMTLSSLRSMP